MLADVVLHIGTSRFFDTLYAHMREHTNARQLVLQRFPGTRAIVEPIAVLSDDNASCERRVSEYVNGLHRVDPLRDLLTPSDERQIIVRAVDAEHIRDQEYRDKLFARADLAGKLCVMVRRPDGALCLTIYRGREAGAFRSADLRGLMSQADVISAAVERHCELSPDERPDIDRLSRAFIALRRGKPLSEREALVLAYVATGHSNLAISLHLDISFHSVSTYRRRAYAKLGITSQAELFALALSVHATTAPSRLS